VETGKKKGVLLIHNKLSRGGGRKTKPLDKFAGTYLSAQWTSPVTPEGGGVPKSGSSIGRTRKNLIYSGVGGENNLLDSINRK